MAISNFISDATLKEAVKAALGLQSGDTLSNEWDQIVTDANRQATLDIYERLCQQGFTPSQIATWDLGADYAKCQGTFWALTWGAGLGGYSAPKLEHLDRREDLSEKSVLIVDGVAVAPTVGESDVGGISFGVSAASESAALQYQRFNTGWCC